MAVTRRKRGELQRELILEEKLLAAMATPDNGLFIDVRRNGDMLTARFSWSESFKVKTREIVLCRDNACYPGEFVRVLDEIAAVAAGVKHG